MNLSEKDYYEIISDFDREDLVNKTQQFNKKEIDYFISRYRAKVKDNDTTIILETYHKYKYLENDYFSITIRKFDDEYYTATIPPYEKKGSLITYKCDQWDGLIKNINDISIHFSHYLQIFENSLCNSILY